MINKIKTAKLANKKVVIIVLMVLAFGIGLSSMNYRELASTLPERD